MKRARVLSIAWTVIVVACATLALFGIATFMSHVHRDWAAAGADSEPAPSAAVMARGPDAQARGGDARDAGRPSAGPGGNTRLEPAEPGPVTPPGAGNPRPALDAPASVPAAVVSALRERRLTIPVQGVQSAALVPSFAEARGDRVHEALDIMAAAGTPVLAVEDGTVAKLFTSKAGGLTIYQFDPSRSVAYYYAHLQRYASGLEEGDTIGRGQVIGYVGSTGNADPTAPHLHFAIFRLGPERRWWEGTAIDPYEVLR